MFKRFLQNRLAMIALTAATMGIALAISWPSSPQNQPAEQRRPAAVRGLV